ncbi:MAG: HlyC/CorC family transporter [Spirochaetia bacterium]|nr:HlyC/CorC family transporter [Spirochaetia bacterium]
MIEGIEELEQTSVKEVMVPRIDVSFISDTATKEELLETIAEEGYSRYPVYFETIDNVVGILYVKDIVSIIPTKPLEIRKCMRKPYFVPDTKRLDELLREFKKRKVHIAVAIDEYGGVSGIVTMEDILEVIIGDIQDEFDDDEDEDIIEMGDGIYLCDARTSIDEVNERLHLNLPDLEAETIGGFVFEQFGRIPASQEKVTFDSIDFIVQEIEGHKINSVKIVMKRG